MSFMIPTHILIIYFHLLQSPAALHKSDFVVVLVFLCCCRNWHWDEPSCGYEVCVVMYHQPSAPPGLGGLYMFQWNDDNCETKNNFICKYTAGTTLIHQVLFREY